MQALLNEHTTTDPSEVQNWFKAAPLEHFPKDGGACIQYNELQIAVFNFSEGNEWYACQNLCPHKMQMILARGMTGSHEGEPKVACPYHKKSFSLRSGECLNGDECSIATFPIKIEEGHVYIGFSR